MRIVRVALIAGLLAVASMGFGASGVAAYGHADHPLAQIELSLNCNNPDFPGCQPPPVGFGLGGVWLWIEIDDGDTRRPPTSRARSAVMFAGRAAALSRSAASSTGRSRRRPSAASSSRTRTAITSSTSGRSSAALCRSR